MAVTGGPWQTDEETSLAMSVRIVLVGYGPRSRRAWP